MQMLGHRKSVKIFRSMCILAVPGKYRCLRHFVYIAEIYIVIRWLKFLCQKKLNKNSQFLAKLNKMHHLILWERLLMWGSH